MAKYSSTFPYLAFTGMAVRPHHVDAYSVREHRTYSGAQASAVKSGTGIIAMPSPLNADIMASFEIVVVIGSRKG